jgi:hypothetical protein
MILRPLLSTFSVPALLLACGGAALAQQKLPDRIESPVLFFPADVEAAERQAKEGEIFLTIPFRWAFSGKLDRDVEVVAGEHRATLRAGELLPKVLIPAPGKTNEGRFLFCTRNKVIEDRKGAAPLAALVDSLRDSLRDAQFCVEDTDADGKVDRGVVFGKSKTEIVGESFAPATVTDFANEIIPGAGTGSTSSSTQWARSARGCSSMSGRTAIRVRLARCRAGGSPPKSFPRSNTRQAFRRRPRCSACASRCSVSSRRPTPPPSAGARWQGAANS